VKKDTKKVIAILPFKQVKVLHVDDIRKVITTKHLDKFGQVSEIEMPVESFMINDVEHHVALSDSGIPAEEIEIAILLN